jgi:hypothetical protein
VVFAVLRCDWFYLPTYKKNHTYFNNEAEKMAFLAEKAELIADCKVTIITIADAKIMDNCPNIV